MPPTKKYEDMSNTALSLIFRVKKIQLEMLRDRGYDISAEEGLFDYTLNDFAIWYTELAQKTGKSFRESLNFVYSKPNGEKTHVFYLDTPIKSKTQDVSGNIGKASITEVTKIIQEEGIRNLVLITETELGTEAQKTLFSLKSINVQHFLYRQLGYNPTQHYLVPKHEALTDEELTVFLRTNNLKITELPIISSHDPISRYYGLIPGQVVRAHRLNFFTETMVDTYEAFRYVKDTPLIFTTKVSKKGGVE